MQRSSLRVQTANYDVHSREKRVFAVKADANDVVDQPLYVGKQCDLSINLTCESAKSKISMANIEQIHMEIKTVSTKVRINTCRAFQGASSQRL